MNNQGFKCTWKCISSPNPLHHATPSAVVGLAKKIMQVLQRGEQETMNANFPKPTIKEDTVSIKIAQAEYEKGMDDCISHIH